MLKREKQIVPALKYIRAHKISSEWTGLLAAEAAIGAGDKTDDYASDQQLRTFSGIEDAVKEHNSAHTEFERVSEILRIISTRLKDKSLSAEEKAQLEGNRREVVRKRNLLKSQISSTNNKLPVKARRRHLFI